MKLWLVLSGSRLTHVQRGWLQVGGYLPNSLGGPSKVSSVCLRWVWESSRHRSCPASVLMNPGSLGMPIELAFGFFCICDWRRCCNSVFSRLLAGPNEETGRMRWHSHFSENAGFCYHWFYRFDYAWNWSILSKSHYHVTRGRINTSITPLKWKYFLLHLDKFRKW